MEPGPPSTPSGVAAAFSLGRGLSHIVVFFKLGITFLVLSLVFRAGTKESDPSGPPSSVQVLSLATS